MMPYEYYNCHPDSHGNFPCDNGFPCDKCSYTTMGITTKELIDKQNSQIEKQPLSQVR